MSMSENISLEWYQQFKDWRVAGFVWNPKDDAGERHLVDTLTGRKPKLMAAVVSLSAGKIVYTAATGCGHLNAAIPMNVRFPGYRHSEFRHLKRIESISTSSIPVATPDQASLQHLMRVMTTLVNRYPELAQA